MYHSVKETIVAVNSVDLTYQYHFSINIKPFIYLVALAEQWEHNKKNCVSSNYTDSKKRDNFGKL